MNVPSLQNAKILVTGAGGFLARHTIPRLLDAGAEVIGFDIKNGLEGGNLREVKSKMRLVEGDISKYSDLEKIENPCDYVVHLAAIAAPIQCEQDPARAFLTNVQGTFNVLKLAAKNKAKKLLFSCYDEGTLAFTLDGLKHYSELRIGDRVLSITPLGAVEVDRITAIHTYPFDGEMIQFKGRSTDLLVTPNHRMLIRTNSSGKWTMRFQAAQEVAQRSVFKLPEGVWNGEEQDHIRVGEKAYETENIFYLVGIYIGDGHSDIQERIEPSKSGLTHAEFVRTMRDPATQRFVSAPMRIGDRETIRMISYANRFYIPENDKSRAKVENVLHACGIDFTKHKKESYGTIIYFGSREFLELFHQCGTIAPNKRIPRWMLNYGPRYLKALLEGILDSDGNRDNHISTVSLQLVEGLIELGTKLGRGVTVTPHHSRSEIDGRVVESDGFNVYLRRTEKQLRKKNVSTIWCKGTVWCPTVERNHNLLVFRNGKTAFCGNSTAHVYGISPKYMPTDENHPLALLDTYTSTKILGESLCQLFYSNHHLAYITTRLFNGYGPGQNTDYFIPAMVAKAKTGRIELRGRNITKDFVYVEDVGDAFIRALMSDYVGEVNIGTGKQSTLEYVARHIAKALGAELTFSSVDPAGPTHMQCDPTRALKILGWKASTPIEQGLDKTIAASK